MGEKSDHASELKAAKSVLTRAVVGPQIDAIRRLLKAREAAADPEQLRASARHAAEELLEHARRKGKELRDQVERDIASKHQDWHEAYRAALDAGWTVELLAEAEQPPPPSKVRGRRGGRRSSSTKSATDPVRPEGQKVHASVSRESVQVSAIGPTRRQLEDDGEGL